MITILGVEANCFLAFQLNPLNVGAGNRREEHGPVSIGPLPFKIPPPDGVWYEMAGKYGVFTVSVPAGFFDKDPRKKLRYKYAHHADLSGTLIPKCVSKSPCPDFPYTTEKTSVWEEGFFSPPDFSYLAFTAGEVGFGYADLQNDLDNSLRPVLNRSDITVYCVDGDEFWSGDPWFSPNGNPRTFQFSRDNVVVEASNVLRKEFVGEACSKANNWPQWLLGPPHVLSGARQISTVTLKTIRNGGPGDVEMTMDISWSQLYYEGSNQSTSFEFQIFEDVLCRPLIAGGGFPRPPDKDQISERLRRLSGSLIHSPDIPYQMKIRRTESITKIEDLGTNNLENLSGLAGFGQILSTLLEGYRAFKNLNIRAAGKFLADAYLIYKFALESSARDVAGVRKNWKSATKNLQDSFALQNRRSCGPIVVDHPAFQLTKSTACAQFVLRRNIDLESSIVNSLEALGLFPSAANLWSLIPLSFVVDWFTGIDGYLAALRWERDPRHYTFVKRIESLKFEYRLRPKGLADVFGLEFAPATPVTGKIFRRTTADTWGSFDPGGLLGIKSLGWDQLIQGGALTLQRILA